MPLHMGKQRPPVGESQNVVDRVEHTTDHVESLIQAKSDHILPGQLGLWHFSRRNCQHSAGKVHARNIVATRQMLQNRACAATEFQDAFRPWARIADISVKALCRSPGIAHHRVIEFAENVVARHGILNLPEVAQTEARCAVRRIENMAIRRRESCKRRSRILDSCGCL